MTTEELKTLETFENIIDDNKAWMCLDENQTAKDVLQTSWSDLENLYTGSIDLQNISKEMQTEIDKIYENLKLEF